MTVERGKARCGQRFVDRRPVIDPRKMGSGCGCMRRQPSSEIGVDETSSARPAAVMDKSDNRPDSEVTKPLETLAMPSPKARRIVAMRKAFPKQRISQRGNSQRRKAVEITFTPFVAARTQLIGKVIADPIDGAFGAAPDGQRDKRWKVRQRLSFAPPAPQLATDKQRGSVWLAATLSEQTY